MLDIENKIKDRLEGVDGGFDTPTAKEELVIL